MEEFTGKYCETTGVKVHKFDNRLRWMTLAGNLLRNPLTDLTSNWFDTQDDKLCGFFERRMMNCLEAYGFQQSTIHCRNLVNDFHECHADWKLAKRLTTIRDERRRQFDAKERKVKYAYPPKLGSLDPFY